MLKTVTNNQQIVNIHFCLDLLEIEINSFISCCFTLVANVSRYCRYSLGMRCCFYYI